MHLDVQWGITYGFQDDGFQDAALIPWERPPRSSNNGVTGKRVPSTKRQFARQ